MNPPLSPQSPNWKGLAGNESFSQPLFEVYSWFDGFEEDTVDYASQISLWPTSKILRERSTENGDNLVIGDFLIYSDLIALDPTGRVKFIFENKTIADSLVAFLSDLCKGRHDF